MNTPRRFTGSFVEKRFSQTVNKGRCDWPRCLWEDVGILNLRIKIRRGSERVLIPLYAWTHSEWINTRTYLNTFNSVDAPPCHPTTRSQINPNKDIFLLMLPCFDPFCVPLLRFTAFSPIKNARNQHWRAKLIINRNALEKKKCRLAEKGVLVDRSRSSQPKSNWISRQLRRQIEAAEAGPCCSLAVFLTFLHKRKTKTKKPSSLGFLREQLSDEKGNKSFLVI